MMEKTRTFNGGSIGTPGKTNDEENMDIVSVVQDTTSSGWGYGGNWSIAYDQWIIQVKEFYQLSLSHNHFVYTGGGLNSTPWKTNVQHR